MSSGGAEQAQPRGCGNVRTVSKPGVSQSKFNIESVLCGDGSRHNGVSLNNLVFYASGRIDGGRESYHQIDPSSLALSTRGATMGGNWRTRPITEAAKKRPMTEVPRITIPSNKRENRTYKQKKLRQAALAWMFVNRGVALSVGGPGSREGIPNVSQYYAREAGVVFEQQQDDNCMSAAIVNALDIVRGRSVAEAVQAFIEEDAPHLLSLKDVPPLLQRAGAKAEAQRIPKSERPVFLSDPFRYISRATSGVYLLHLHQLGVVDHIVVVDANRNLIIDSAEEYPMRCSEELLRKCGGKEAEKLQIIGARILIDQAASHKELSHK